MEWDAGFITGILFFLLNYQSVDVNIGEIFVFLRLQRLRINHKKTVCQIFFTINELKFFVSKKSCTFVPALVPVCDSAFPD